MRCPCATRAARTLSARAQATIARSMMWGPGSGLRHHHIRTLREGSENCPTRLIDLDGKTTSTKRRHTAAAGPRRTSCATLLRHQWRRPSLLPGSHIFEPAVFQVSSPTRLTNQHSPSQNGRVWHGEAWAYSSLGEECIVTTSQTNRFFSSFSFFLLFPAFFSLLLLP